MADSRKIPNFQVPFVLLLLFLEGDVRVERLRAVGAFGEEVKPDAANVLLGAEVLEVGYLVAFDFELQHAPVLQSDAVTIAEMTADDVREPEHHAEHVALAGARAHHRQDLSAELDVHRQQDPRPVLRFIRPRNRQLHSRHRPQRAPIRFRQPPHQPRHGIQGGREVNGRTSM